MIDYNQRLERGKGNIPINHDLAKKIEDGKIIQDLPLLNVDGELLPLFSVLSSHTCPQCNSILYQHKEYTRWIISSYGIHGIDVNHKICSRIGCGYNVTDSILGVKDGANYSNEFKEKQKHIRFDTQSTLSKTRRAGEIYTEGKTDVHGRAPCPTTLWKHEQEQGTISNEKLLNEEVPFDGDLFIDGKWVKCRTKKELESLIGAEISDRQWKMLRYMVVYVVMTKDKVAVDFEITNINPSYVALIPLLERVKRRFPKGTIKRIISDEEDAIIDAVSTVFPNIAHCFCNFHQQMNLNKKFNDQFKGGLEIPKVDAEIYTLAQSLVIATNIIESSILLNQIHALARKSVILKGTTNVVNYINELYNKNRRLMEKGFLPITNNTMEEFFSLISGFFDQIKTFRISSGLKNFISNLLLLSNHRPFNYGSSRGWSPMQRAMIRLG